MLRKLHEISEFKEIKNDIAKIYDDDIAKTKALLCAHACRKFMENFVVKGVISGLVFRRHFCLFVFERKRLPPVGVVT